MITIGCWGYLLTGQGERESSEFQNIEGFFFMLNVIALRPASKKQPETIEPEKPAPPVRHHVLRNSATENSGRLSCEDDIEIEVPQCDIYAAR